MTQNDSRFSSLRITFRFGCLMVFGLINASCGFGYVVSSSYHQMTLLWSRVPVEDVRTSGKLTSQQIDALDVVADVRSFGQEIGLAASDNYTTVALDWDKTIWNVSGCSPDKFDAKTWWFPIVGRVPYLGYFYEDDVRLKAEELRADGLDVYVRKVAAYSTLGWFEDPILVPMLSWRQFDIARLILHELTHATLWLPSDVRFNESFANFVGDVAAERYMASRHGIQGEAYLHALARRADQKRWRSLLRAVYLELDTLYTSGDTTKAQRLAGKAAVFATLPARVEAAGFEWPENYMRSAREGVWNNARMIQFRAYNQDEELFRDILNEVGGDIVAFIFRVGNLVDGADDPREALRNFRDTGAAAHEQAPN